MQKQKNWAHEDDRVSIEIEQRFEKLRASLARKEDAVTPLNAALAGVPSEQDRNRIIWQGLVGFANARLGHRDGLRYFRASTNLCCLRLEELFANPMEDLRCFEDVEQEQKRTGQSAEDAFRDRVRVFHEPVRIALRWLADPNAFSWGARSYALEFLLEHGNESSLQFSMDPVNEFDDTAKKGIPLFYWKNIYGYRTVFTPVAKFILDRLEQYHERSLSLDDAIPLIVCRRAGCDRFSVGRRKAKAFCSNSCRTLHRQKTKAKEWAAYMRRYRAENA